MNLRCPPAYNAPFVGNLTVPFISYQVVKLPPRQNMVTEQHNIASRMLLKAISKGTLGAGTLASMDIGSADRLALQDLQGVTREKRPQSRHLTAS
eukprot:264184-Pelagomonas_calceolata.AAC.1